MRYNKSLLPYSRENMTFYSILNKGIPERELLRVVEALRFVEGLGERPRPLGCTVSLAILSLDISFANPVADTFGGGLFGV